MTLALLSPKVPDTIEQGASIAPGVIEPGVIEPGVIEPGVIEPGVIEPGVAAKPGLAPSPVWPRKRVLHWVAVVIGVGVVAFLAVELWGLVSRPPELSVVAARVSDVSRMLAVTGRVEAERSVIVSPQLTGRLTEFLHYEGESVKAGDVLARLDDVNARAAVSQQKASLASRRNDLAQARRDLVRAAALGASGALPIADVEQARLMVSRAESDVTRLGAVLGSGQAQLALVAPFSGTIVRRDGELGQIVGPATAVFVIATVDASRVSAEVDERYVRVLRRGMKAEILPVGDGEAKRSAIISYVAQEVDPQTGAATVRFTYNAPPKKTLIGMSVDINISVEELRKALVVPRESVGGVGAQPFVLVVIGGRALRRNVTVDDWPAELVVVREGLKNGELVAVDPKSVANNARVRVNAGARGL